MSKMKLTKPWQNHPKGTVLESVSPGVETELVKGKFANKPEPKKKVAKGPPSDKAISAPETK